MLKKFIIYSLMMLLSFSFLTGCTDRSSGVKELVVDQTLIGQVEMDDLSYKIRLEQKGGSYQFTFLDKNDQDSMQYLYQNGSVTISFLGMETISNQELLQNSIPSAIASSFENARVSQNIKKGMNHYTIEGATENGAYTLKVNNDTGIPISLEIPSLSFVCDFTSG